MNIILRAIEKTDAWKVKRAGYALKGKFGITPDEYQSILTRQNGVCAICELRETTKRLAVDHCHRTGRIRGLLCSNCNRGLGFFKDRVTKLIEAARYLLRATSHN